MSIQGEVKWFDPKKGYGFIVGPEGQDVFVHFSQIMGDGFRSLKDGEQVEYELSEGDKGLQAREVNRVEVSASAPEPQDAPEHQRVHAE
ncbi:MAG: cold shock domain-containing protein [Phycisphaeraceae bacterium]|nr:cold shock domain-containing protein [Phycisphaeraceae bacterium]